MSLQATNVVPLGDQNEQETQSWFEKLWGDDQLFYTK